MTVDFDDWGYFGGLDHESKVHIVATIILHEEGGPLAEELLSMRPLDGDAPPAAAEDLRRRRAFLKRTLAWPAAEQMLTGRG